MTAAFGFGPIVIISAAVDDQVIVEQLDISALENHVQAEFIAERQLAE